MTELLDKAIREAQALPPEAQDAVAQVRLSYVGDADTVIELTRCDGKILGSATPTSRLPLATL